MSAVGSVYREAPRVHRSEPVHFIPAAHEGLNARLTLAPHSRIPFALERSRVVVMQGDRGSRTCALDALDDTPPTPPRIREGPGEGR